MKRAATMVTPTCAALVLLLGTWIVAAAMLVPESALDGVAMRGGAAGMGMIALIAAGYLPPALLPVLATVGAASLAIRVPVPIGDEQVMLLMPLYTVLALVAAMIVRDEVRRHFLRDEVPAPRPVVRRTNRAVLLAATAYVALAAASLLWTQSRQDTGELIGLVLIPFLLTIVVVRALIARRIDLRPPAIALVTVALIAAFAGLVQSAATDVWWHEGVRAANRFRSIVRTNGIFYDPNMYGRYLVVAVLVIAAWVVAGPRRDRSPLRATFLAIISSILLVALWYSYSQSSLVALAAAAFTLMLLTLPPRARRIAAAITLVVVLVLGPMGWRALSGPDVSGRSTVVRGGITLVEHRPVLGWGAGAFESAYRAHIPRDHTRRATVTASHTTPVTVAAELGVVGLAAYGMLLGAAAAALALRWKRASMRANIGRDAGSSDGPTNARDTAGWPLPATFWATSVLAATTAHSMLYAGFFEDPLVWVALALASAIPRVEASTSSPSMR